MLSLLSVCIGKYLQYVFKDFLMYFQIFLFSGQETTYINKKTMMCIEGSSVIYWGNDSCLDASSLRFSVSPTKCSTA